MGNWNKVKGEIQEDILEHCPRCDMGDIDCLVIKKNSKHIEHLVWNSHYKVWNDSDGNDFNCEAKDVAFWKCFPKLPEELM